MPTINSRDLVRQSIQNEWPAFAADHPRLAAVLDESILIEPATAALLDDPAFQEAMATAAGLGLMAETVAAVVQRFVHGWLRQLL